MADEVVYRVVSDDVPDLIGEADVRRWRRIEAVARELLAATDGEQAHKMWAVLGRLRAVMKEAGDG